jgi:hypothetical protein
MALMLIVRHLALVGRKYPHVFSKLTMLLPLFGLYIGAGT